MFNNLPHCQTENQERAPLAFVLIIQQSLTCCEGKRKKKLGLGSQFFGFKFCYYGAETFTEEFCEHLATLGRDERHSTLTLFSSNYSR